MMRKLWVFGFLIVSSLAPGSAYADPEPTVARPGQDLRWAPVTAGDYVSTGVLGLGSLLVIEYLPPPTSTSWTGGILFDNTVRDSLKIGSPGGRAFANSLSYATFGVAIAMPLVLDSVVFAGLRDTNFQGALRVAVISLQALAMTEFLSEVFKDVVGRARPYTIGCATNSNYDPGCGTTDANRSFFSGHSSISFTAAGLVCVNHAKLGLGKSAKWDHVACGAAISLAAITGYLRIAADQHYASDVLVGAAIGFSSGYFLPSLLHSVEKSDGSGQNLSLAPTGLGSVALMETIRF